MPGKVFKAKVVALVSEEAVKRGKPLFSAPTMVSRKFFSNLNNELGLTSKNGEETTEAGAKGAADIRHCARLTAGQSVMSAVVNSASNCY